VTLLRSFSSIVDVAATPSMHPHMVLGPNDEICVAALIWLYRTWSTAMRPAMQPCQTAPPETRQVGGVTRAFPRDLVALSIGREGCVTDICQTRSYLQSTRQSRVSRHATPCSVIRPCCGATQVIDACTTAEPWKIGLTWSQLMRDTISSRIRYADAQDVLSQESGDVDRL
jgi:hypothetical protein